MLVGIDNIACECDQILVGVDGIAYEVESIYIGDEDGIAQLVEI